MNWLTENTIDWVLFIELFILAFVAFLIGYFFGKKDHKSSSQSLVKINNNQPVNPNDIETIFSEIKPDIIKIIENHKKGSESFHIKTSPKWELNFDSFGYADEKNKDDLTKIDGLSPFIEDKLNQLGILNYSQLSRFTFEDITALTNLIEYFPGRIERDNWVGQARLLQKNKATL